MVTSIIIIPIILLLLILAGFAFWIYELSRRLTSLQKAYKKVLWLLNQRIDLILQHLKLEEREVPAEAAKKILVKKVNNTKS